MIEIDGRCINWKDYYSKNTLLLISLKSHFLASNTLSTLYLILLEAVLEVLLGGFSSFQSPEFIQNICLSWSHGLWGEPQACDWEAAFCSSVCVLLCHAVDIGLHFLWSFNVNSYCWFIWLWVWFYGRIILFYYYIFVI